MTTVSNGLSFRPMGDDDIDAAWQLSQALQWPHRREDWRFIAQFGGGWLAELDQKLVGTVLWSRFGETHGSIGLVIVADNAQRMGIGQSLMEHALAELAGRTVLLNATEAGMRLYEKLGFVRVGEVVQYQSNAFMAPPVMLQSGEVLRPLRANEHDNAVTMLSSAVGYDRAQIVAALASAADGVVIERAGEVVGLGFMRPYGRGYGIAPVIADTPSVAQAIYAHFLNLHPGTFVRTDIDAASGIGTWLESTGLKKSSVVVQMRRGEDRGMTPNGQSFGIVNQALG